jgi:hypothetical protein
MLRSHDEYQLKAERLLHAKGRYFDLVPEQAPTLRVETSRARSDRE